jgi:hypothetical protein
MPIIHYHILLETGHSYLTRLRLRLYFRVPFSPGDYSTSSALALGSSDGGSNPLVTEATSTDSLDLLCDPAEGELMTKEDFNALIDFNTTVDSYVAEKIVQVG